MIPDFTAIVLPYTLVGYAVFIVLLILRWAFNRYEIVDHEDENMDEETCVIYVCFNRKEAKKHFMQYVEEKGYLKGHSYKFCLIRKYTWFGVRYSGFYVYSALWEQFIFHKINNKQLQ